MSKTIDALKRPDIRSQVRNQPIHDDIAETYFKTPAPAGPRKVKKAPKLPWVITAIAVLVALVVLISRSNIDIRVRILSEKAPSAPAGALPGSDRGVYLLKGAEINNGLIKETFFSGDAKAYSRLTGSGIVLCNSRGNGWASYTMQFKEPLDLTKLVINFRASGERGEERVGVAIVDADNRTYRIEKDLSPKLGKEEKVYAIDFGNTRKMLDLANISAIKFEFGSLTVGNGSMATIFLKEVYASKTKRMRWL